jgi:hypothetical protein
MKQSSLVRFSGGESGSDLSNKGGMRRLAISLTIQDAVTARIGPLFGGCKHGVLEDQREVRAQSHSAVFGAGLSDGCRVEARIFGDW